jgi:hypothetical protein
MEDKDVGYSCATRIEKGIGKQVKKTSKHDRR